MAEQKPLVLINGEIEQIPATDTLPVGILGYTPTNNATFLIELENIARYTFYRS